MDKTDIFFGTKEMINSQASAWIDNESHTIIKKVETGGNSIEGNNWMIVYYEV